MSSKEIRNELTELAQRLDRLPEANEPPPTTLQILGRSRREKYWQRLLVHFLSPKESHGMEEALLDFFLSELSARPEIDLDFSRLELEDIEVEKEIATSQGRPDVLIWSSKNWFLCFELKVDSAEGNDQTQRYVEIESFDEVDVDKCNVPSNGHQYVYLAPADAPSPAAEEFVHISWEWLALEFRSFLEESYGEYPFRTTTQLNDFVDTIQSELTMTEFQESRQEKVELAVEHYESMRAVLDTLEEYVEDLQERWPDWLIEQSPSGWDENWNAPETSNSYLTTYRDEWTVDFDADSMSSSGLAIYWEFRMTDRHLGQSRIEHRIIVTGENKRLLQKFREEFYSEAVQDQASTILSDICTDPNKEMRLQKWDDHTYEKIVSGDYQFEFRNGSGVSEAVVEAFEDLEPVFDLVSQSIPQQ